MFVSSNDSMKCVLVSCCRVSCWAVVLLSRCTERQFLAFPLAVLSLVYYLLGMKVKNNWRS